MDGMKNVFFLMFNIVLIIWKKRIKHFIRSFEEVMWGTPHKYYFNPIGSAILMFIGYKRTNRHPDKQNI